MDDERRARRALGQRRSTQRKVPQDRADEQRLTDDIIELAVQYGGYGYRMSRPWLRHRSEPPIDDGLLNNAGWHVNHKWGERRAIKSALVARTNGALNGSIQDRTHDGGAYRTLNKETVFGCLGLAP